MTPEMLYYSKKRIQSTGRMLYILLFLVFPTTCSTTKDEIHVDFEAANDVIIKSEIPTNLTFFEVKTKQINVDTNEEKLLFDNAFVRGLQDIDEEDVLFEISRGGGIKTPVKLYKIPSPNSSRYLQYYHLVGTAADTVNQVHLRWEIKSSNPDDDDTLDIRIKYVFNSIIQIDTLPAEISENKSINVKCQVKQDHDHLQTVEILDRGKPLVSCSNSSMFVCSHEIITQRTSEHHLFTCMLRRQADDKDTRWSYHETASSVKVLYGPDKLSMNPVINPVYIGQKITLTCESSPITVTPTNSLNLTTTWYKDDISLCSQSCYDNSPNSGGCGAHLVEYRICTFYYIFDVAEDSSGIYKCMMPNTLGDEVHTSSSVEVKLAPTEISLLTNKQLVAEVGHAVTLRCKSDSALAQYEIQWFQGDERLDCSSTTLCTVSPAPNHDEFSSVSTLEITMEQDSGGRYSCQAENKQGDVLSDWASVSLIVNAPVLCEAYTDSDISLECRINRGDTIKSGQFQWKSDGGTIEEILALNVEDAAGAVGNKYHCEVNGTYSVYRGSFTVPKANFTHDQCGNLKIPPSHIVMSSEFDKVYTGVAVSFRCDIDTTLRQFVIQWFKGDEEFECSSSASCNMEQTVNKEANSSSSTIRFETDQFSGAQYKCKVPGINNSLLSDTQDLIVIVPGRITCKAGEDEDEDKVFLQCNPEIQKSETQKFGWQFRVNQQNSWQNLTEDGKSLTATQIGDYQCHEFDTYKIIQGLFTVKHPNITTDKCGSMKRGLYPTKIEMKSPRLNELMPGTPVTLRCVADSALRKFQIQWRMGSKSLECKQSDSCRVETNFNDDDFYSTSTLSLIKTTLVSGDRYTCQISDENNALLSDYADVIVIAEDLIGCEVNNDDEFSLICNVAPQDTDAKFIWHFRPKGETNWKLLAEETEIYQIKSLTELDVGEYKCRAANQYTQGRFKLPELEEAKETCSSKLKAEDVDEKPYSDVSAAGVGVGLALLSTLSLLTLFLVYKKRKKEDK